jgi:hypothetical protein
LGVRVEESQVLAILGDVLMLGQREEIPAAPIAEVLGLLGVGEVYAAYAPEGMYHLGSRKDLWFACDVGLLYCTLSGGLFDPLVLKSDLTAWRDVRDVELGSRIARKVEPKYRVSRMPEQETERAREVTEVHLVIQVPRLDADEYGAGRPTRQLASFARQVLLHSGATAD